MPGGKSRRMELNKTASTSAAKGDAENEKTEIPGRHQPEKHHRERPGSQINCPADRRKNRRRQQRTGMHGAGHKICGADNLLPHQHRNS